MQKQLKGIKLRRICLISINTIKNIHSKLKNDVKKKHSRESTLARFKNCRSRSGSSEKSNTKSKKKIIT
jgi:hypothetical protein